MTAERPLLFLGDIHLGRRPTGLDDALNQAGLRAGDLSPAAALDAAVAHALAVRARAVVLAGDVVESSRDRFEAFAHLERAAGTLIRAEIPVLAVAGNHDAQVLPRLCARLPAVRLLGAGGRWERVALPAAAGEPAVTLAGWSFPAETYRLDPFDAPGAAEALARPASGALVVVLHADLDASGSPYAPTRRARLRSCGADAALVGHVHAPDALNEEPFGYLGSLCGLDAGEPFARGPWELRVGGEVRAEQVALAPIHFATLPADARWPEDDLDQLHEELVDAARSYHAPDAARVVVLRLVLEGAAASAPVVAADLALPWVLPPPAGSVAWRVVTHVIDWRTPAADHGHVDAHTPSGRALAWNDGVFPFEVEALRAEAEAIVAGAGALVRPASLPPPDIHELIDEAARRATWALLAARRAARDGGA